MDIEQDNILDCRFRLLPEPPTKFISSMEVWLFQGTCTTTVLLSRRTITLSILKGTPIVFPDSLPPSAGYTIAIVASTGSLSNVTVQSVNFVFTPLQNSSSPAVTAATVSSQGSFWYGYLIFFLFVAPLCMAFFLYNRYRHDEDDFKPWQIGVAIGVGIICRLALAPVAAQPFDISVYATSARGWFEFGSPGTSLGPTLPFTFFLYWVPYSFYALALKSRFPGLFHTRTPNWLFRINISEGVPDHCGPIRNLPDPEIQPGQGRKTFRLLLSPESAFDLRFLSVGPVRGCDSLIHRSGLCLHV